MVGCQQLGIHRQHCSGLRALNALFDGSQRLSAIAEAGDAGHALGDNERKPIPVNIMRSLTISPLLLPVTKGIQVSK